MIWLFLRMGAEAIAIGAFVFAVLFWSAVLS